MITNILPALLSVALSTATLEVRTGLLDRLVQHYKQNFFGDLVDIAPVLVNVSIQRAPPGYVDSSEWDYDSVIRLIGLIRESEPHLPLPVRRMLREILPPPASSRRFGGMGSMHKARQRAAAILRKCTGDPSRPGYPKNCPRRGLRRARGKFQDARKNSLSRLHIPSFPNPNPNDLYYDEMISIEQPPDTDKLGPPPGPYNATMQDDDIVVISNPVEARLPSGHLSIGMLRRILEARAEAARVMPTRPTTTVNIASTNKTSATEETGGDNSTDTGATEGDTGATGDGGGATGGGRDGEATTPAAGAEGGGEGGGGEPAPEEGGE